MGRPTDPASEGCNRLIADHQAELVTSASDIVRLLKWQPAPAPAEFVPPSFAHADKAKTTLAALPVARGTAPVPPESKDESASDAAILAEYRTLKGKSRDAFFAKHTDAIWRAASAS